MTICLVSPHDIFHTNNVDLCSVLLGLTLERSSASIDAIEVFNFLCFHQILICSAETSGHFLYYCNAEFLCFLRVLRLKQQI